MKYGSPLDAIGIIALPAIMFLLPAAMYNHASACAPKTQTAPADNTKVNTSTAADPVYLTTGAHYVDRSELMIGGIMPMGITCRFFSNVHSFGHFGHGWQWDMDMRLYRMQQDKSEDVYVVRGLQGEIRQFSLEGNSITNATPRGKITVTASGYILLLENRLTYHFDTKGLLTRIEDRNGNAICIAYATDAESNDILNLPMYGTTPDENQRETIVAMDARPIKIHSASDSSRHIIFTYNSLGYIATARDFTGRTYKYEYDSRANLTKITDPQGNVKIFFYQDEDRPYLLTGYTRFTSDPNNTVQVIRIKYDDEERVIEQIDRGYKFVLEYPEDMEQTYDTTISGQTVEKQTTIMTRIVKEYNNKGSGYYLVKKITHIDTTVMFTPPLAPNRSSITKTTAF